MFDTEIKEDLAVDVDSDAEIPCKSMRASRCPQLAVWFAVSKLMKMRYPICHEHYVWWHNYHDHWGFDKFDWKFYRI